MTRPTEAPPGAEWDPGLEMWTLKLGDPAAEDEFFQWWTTEAQESHPRRAEIDAVVEKLKSLRPPGVDGAWVINNSTLTSLENLARLAVEAAAEVRETI